MGEASWLLRAPCGLQGGHLGRWMGVRWTASILWLGSLAEIFVGTRVSRSGPFVGMDGEDELLNYGGCLSNECVPWGDFRGALGSESVL